MQNKETAGREELTGFVNRPMKKTAEYHGDSMLLSRSIGYRIGSDRLGLARAYLIGLSLTWLGSFDTSQFTLLYIKMKTFA